ncbi:glutathione S-transferase theta-1-like [Mizuhopecten yessoensis]|uniref:Glutathione S-transferase theta-1 n=1 Tax=Mizuhopecten yessoensis TaxID=6573 RepID=A0A210QGZ9_MIZYE|nr:glutathione S-transferase theta-1-like [Mizuhopecten yessoensis]OWF47901.1 Glutathione S-transferase theta-1 [Mizuhopecten yessoensis]
MALKYYYDLMSQPSRAVYIFLKMTNIPFVPKPVALRSGEHHTDEYKKLNPLSLVPVIDDDGFVLTESVAILKYLAVKYNVADHWYPRTDLQAQARVDEYMNYQHMNTRYNGGMIFQQLVIIPRAMRAKIQWPMVENARNRLENVVSHLENYFLKDNKPYLCGSDISLADLLGICELMQLYACCEENIYESNPVVKAWVDRVMARTAPHFEEANKIVNRSRSVYSKQKKAQENAKL